MFYGAVGWNIATTRDENTETLNHDFFAYSKKVIMTEYRYQNKIYIVNLNTFYYL